MSPPAARVGGFALFVIARSETGCTTTVALHCDCAPALSATVNEMGKLPIWLPPGDQEKELDSPLALPLRGRIGDIDAPAGMPDALKMI